MSPKQKEGHIAGEIVKLNICSLGGEGGMAGRRMRPTHGEG